MTNILLQTDQKLSIKRIVSLLSKPGPHFTYIFFFCVIGFFILFAPNFATLGTASAVGRITAVVTIMAVGMTFVIVCAEIDLSVGSHVSFAAMVAGILLYRDVPGWLTSSLVLVLGAFVGAIKRRPVPRATGLATVVPRCGVWCGT